MTVASSFFPVMTQLTGNAGGGVEALPSVTANGGRERVAGGTLTLAAQASGSVIGVARLPLGAIISGLTVVTDTSLGSATIALGDTNSGALYAAAMTLTTTNTPTRIGNAVAHMAPIVTGYDCTTGLKSLSYEDITLTTAGATLPASGNLTVVIEYVID
jgi:hypothetical protein